MRGEPAPRSVYSEGAAALSLPPSFPPSAHGRGDFLEGMTASGRLPARTGATEAHRFDQLGVRPAPRAHGRDRTGPARYPMTVTKCQSRLLARFVTVTYPGVPSRRT